MGSGLWMPNGSFLEFSEQSDRKALLTEIATQEAAGGGLLAGMGALPDPDPILKKRGEGVNVLRELRADDKVISTIQSRKLGTLKKQNYVLEPGHAEGEEPTKEAIQVCKDLEKDLGRIDLYNLFSQILDAPYFGFTPAEILYEPDGGRLMVTDIKPRQVEWFGYDSEEKLVFKSQDNPGGMSLPPHKFIVARHFPEAGNPYGLRLLSRVLWPVAFKKGGLKFWLVFAEKFGIPWTVVTSRQGATETEIANMRSQLASMVQDAVAVVSGGAEVKVIETSGKGGDLTFSKLIDAMNTAIATVLMGQTLTADIGDTGSRAASETHYGVLGDYREADERLLCAAMNDAADCYCRVNASPDVFRPVFRYVEPEDYEARAELDKRLYDLDVRFKKTHFVQAYGLPEDEFEIAAARPDASAPSADNPKPRSEEFAEGAEKIPEAQQTLDGFTDKLIPKGAEIAAKTGQKILAIVEKSNDPDEMMDNLADALAAGEIAGDMNELMAQALLAADMFGRAAVKEEMAGDE